MANATSSLVFAVFFAAVTPADSRIDFLRPAYRRVIAAELPKVNIIISLRQRPALGPVDLVIPVGPLGSINVVARHLHLHVLGFRTGVTSAGNLSVLPVVQALDYFFDISSKGVPEKSVGR